MRMIKGMLVALATLFSTVLYGAVDDYILTFSMENGAYADGSAVLEGEFYGLVWQRDGVEFAGLDAELQPVDAANTKFLGACALTSSAGRRAWAIAVSRAELGSTFAGGSFFVLLLDTRVPGEATLSGVKADGQPVAVQSWRTLGGFDFSTSGVTTAFSPLAIAAQGVTAVPVAALSNPPRIVALTPVEGGFELTVAGTYPGLFYLVAKSSSLQNLSSTPVEGASCVLGGPEFVTLRVPATEKMGFFNLVRGK